MKEKTFISSYQAILLILFTHVPTAVFYIPGVAVSVVNQDAWIAVIIGTFLVGLLVIYPLADLGMKYPEKTIVQYSENIMGKFLGKIFGFLLISWFFLMHCWSIRNFSEVAILFLPDTPIVFIAIIMALLIAYATYYGIEVIARCTEFVFPLGIFSLLFITIASFEKINFSNLLPVMESGILPLIRATIYPLDWMSISFFFGVITPFINTKTDLRKIGLTGIGLAGIMLTFFSIIVISVLGPTMLNVSNFSLLSMARYVQFPTIERVESFIIILWITWLFIRGAFTGYCTVLGLKQLFKLDDYRFLIIPESIFAVAYSIYMYDSFTEMNYIFSIANLLYIIFQAGIPFTLWIVSLVRCKL